MAKLKITLPSQEIFATEIPITIGQINYGNHLGHDSLVTLIHEARVRFLLHLGQSEMKFLGVGLILKDLSVLYKTEAFYGETLVFQLFLGEVSVHAFELFYLISKKTNTEVARAQTTMVCFDYQNKKVVPIPEGLNKLIQLPNSPQP